MSFSSAEVHAHFASETDHSARLEHALTVKWCYLFRSGRREGHDIPKLPRAASCVLCRRAFGTLRGLERHHGQSRCGGRP